MFRRVQELGKTEKAEKWLIFRVLQKWQSAAGLVTF
jgi:hypothetical protein